MNLQENPNQGRKYGYKLQALIVLLDILLITIALYCSYLIRFDFDIWAEYRVQAIEFLPIFILIRVTSLYYMGGYRGIWKYTSLNDLIAVSKGILVGTLLLAFVNFFRNIPLGLLISILFFASAVIYRGVFQLRSLGHSRKTIIIGGVIVSGCVLMGGILFFTVLSSAPISLTDIPFMRSMLSPDFQYMQGMPRAVFVLEFILSFLLVGGLRISPRLFQELWVHRKRKGRRVLIFGAGDIGESLIRTMKNYPEFGYHPIGFLDDHPSKLRVSIHGVKVLGTRQELPTVLKQYRVEEVLIAVPSLSGEDLKEIVKACEARHISVRRVPGFSMFLDGQVGLEHLEKVDIEDLLGRSEVTLDPDRVVAYLQGKVVLVTGAGGSIGSELCRQISRCKPTLLVLLGKGENSIYHIEKELESLFPHQEINTVIGSVTDQIKVDYVFNHYRPDVVFHAAAHKHVPFMEENPEEAVLNNVFGTETVARSAIRHGVSKFVLISTDKAVYPSSVMGASKKLAELMLQKLGRESNAIDFVAVRFGNVLRSRGSVVPLFEKQIKEGGPVTVTHPDMTRYFMSIPEAVRLVLHSGAIGNNEDLCILDMGEPVRILDLVENMIRLAGLKPYEDIAISFTGLRPGEKLVEKLLTIEEAKTIKKVDKILVCKSESYDWTEFEDQLRRLKIAATGCRREEIIWIIEEMVPGYQPMMGISIE